MYDVHLRLIGKRVVDFLLVLMDLFCYVLRLEALRAKTDRKSAIGKRVGQYPPNFYVKGSSPTNHFCTVS